VLTVQELGWLQLDFSNWVAVTGVIAAITGVVLGPIIDRLGSLRILKWIVMFRFAIFLAMGLFEGMWGVSSVFKWFMLVNAIATQIVTIALIALFMRLCLNRVSASQFAVYMALANLTYSMGSGLLVLLSGFTDYRGMMLFSSLMIGVMLLLLPLVDLDRHEQDLSKLR
jgi:PAT family beta-lactamase induction signal transducer AmpG